MSIAAGPSPVTEGTAATFVLSRTGSAAEALTVTVGVTETEAMLAANPPSTVTFGAGESSATLTVATDDDAAVEAASVVTVAVVSGDDYTVASGAGSAQATVEDNDAATFEVTAAPTEIAEGESATVTVAVSNGVTFATDQTITLDFAGSTATQGDDYTVSSETLTLGAGTGSVTATLTAVDDSASEEGAETVSVAAAHRGATVGAATVTITDGDGTPLTAAFADLPETHDGATAFTFGLRFSEEIGISHRTLRDHVEVGNGSATNARRIDGRHDLWEIAVQPATTADVTLAVPPSAACGEPGAICDRATGTTALSNRLEATVAGPSEEAEVSIVAGTSPVTEGTAAAFVLSRTGAAAAALTVTVGVTETEAMLAANPPSTVAFGAGESSATLTVPTDDDGVVEAASVVTAEVEDGDDYAVASGSASAEVTVEDNDAAEFTVSADPEEIAEGESSTLTVEIANGVTFAEDQTITLDFVGEHGDAGGRLHGVAGVADAGGGGRLR